LALVLSWEKQSIRDLDIHVEFIASPNIKCKSDFSERNCGGVRQIIDVTNGAEKGADVVKFEKVGNFQYLVYVSLFKHRASPKAADNIDRNLVDSQA
jgi:hypothetical protein